MSYAGIFTDKNNVDHPVTSTLYGTCATAAASAEKAVVCSNVDVLSAGMTLRVVFTYANEAETPTINVNSLGAKSVYRFGTTKPLGGNSWEAGAVVDLFYDGTSFYMLNSDNLGTAAAKDVPASGNASSTQVVLGDDTRLTDARTPVSHTHTKSEITDFPTLGTAAAKNATNAITENSTDLVESGAVYTGLAAKQDASGNSSLTTTDKTIVGAINEVNSNFTSLKEWVDADAKTLTGNPITLTDAAAVNAKALSMTVEPIQDLHGYDKPWVGGAGKNKLPLDLALLKTLNVSGTWVDNVYTLNNVAFTVNLDGGGNVVSIKANGTASAKTIFYLGIFADFLTVDTSYIINSNIYPESDQGAVLQILKANDAGYVSLTEPYSFTYASEGNAQKLVIRVDNTATANNNVFTPMIRLSTETDATFAPYTNICPISGLTSGVVERVGKNLCDTASFTSYAAERIVNLNGIKVTSGTYTASFNVTGLPSSDYRIEFCECSNAQQTQGTQVAGYITGTTVTANSTGRKSVSLTVTEEGYLYLRCVPSGFSLSDIQIEVGSSDTPYEPYNSATATITFGQTVYGCSVDFDSGVMTVTHGILGINDFVMQSGTSPGGLYLADAEVNLYDNTCIANMLETKTTSSGWTSTTPCVIANKTNNRIRVYILDASTFSTTYADLQVVYRLATPTELTLTPAELVLLKGQNTITANGASITLTYQPDNLVGEVMEQVDDIVDPIEARLETVESGLDAVKNRLIASSQSTGTTRSKLNDLYTAWQNLTDDEKRRAYIFAGENTKYNLTNKYYRIFNNTAYSASDSALFSRTIELKSSASTSIAVEIKDTGTTITDKSLDENSTIWHLYV